MAKIFAHLGACTNSMCQRPLLQSGMWLKVETSFIPSLLSACFNLKTTGREMLDHIILQCNGTIDIQSRTCTWYMTHIKYMYYYSVILLC